MTDEEMKLYNDKILKIYKLQTQIKIYTIALNKIASWKEGDEITAKFDCPYHAQIARDAFKEASKL